MMPVSQFQAIIAAMFVFHLAQVLALAEIMRRLERMETAYTNLITKVAVDLFTSYDPKPEEAEG